MKEVFALVIVLSIAGIAHAGLQFTFDGMVLKNGDYYLFPHGVHTFAVVNETVATGVFDGGAFINQESFLDSVMCNPQIVASNLPGSWSVIDVSADLGMPAFFYSWDVPAITPFGTGNLVTVDIVGNGIGKLTFVNVNLEPVFTITYDFWTPEPATLALLSVGVMMIRRKQSA